ncbi:MAG: FecR domain-containing protein [Bdellovibrio sp.]|nr:FecR domain-containing protein [Bdellovibrio sp.]
MKIHLQSVFFLLTFCLAFEAHTQGIKGADPESSQMIDNMVGEVVLVKGDVTKLRADNKKEIKVGTANQIVQEGDTIITAAGGFIKLKMIDDSVVSVGPNSRMVFEKFAFKSKNDRQSVYGFISGKIRAHIPNKAKPGDLVVKTKTSSLGVRGTIFVGNINTNKKGNDVTQFAVVKGSVRVKNEISGESNNIAQKEKIMSITQKNESVVDSGTLALNDEEFNNLVSYDDEKSDQEPVFLDDYQEDKLPGRQISSIGEPEYESGDRTKKSTWRERQEQLNRRLHEYNAN